MSAESARWLEAGKTLGADPRASVPCPQCRAADLVVEDVPFDGGFERILRCPECGATNALLVRGPTARFVASAFSALSSDARADRCRELSRYLTERVRAAPQFHDCVRELVAELRSLGHDLWSFDESPDELEIWCPNYATPSGPGIVVTFTPDDVRVEWSEQR